MPNLESADGPQPVASPIWNCGAQHVMALLTSIGTIVCAGTAALEVDAVGLALERRTYGLLLRERDGGGSSRRCPRIAAIVRPALGSLPEGVMALSRNTRRLAVSLLVLPVHATPSPPGLGGQSATPSVR